MKPDGNSLGWFIDTTPDDNTEFDQTLTSTAFRATTGAASGKYDLLTTILHELGHLKGIISGNTAFDTNVQNINGIPTFINGGITAQLTPDGSHLNHTITWNFGDGTDPITLVGVLGFEAQPNLQSC